MHNEDENWLDDEQPEPSSKHQLEMQKLLSEIERKSKSIFRYLLTEGFVEKTDTPGEYKYTPEGFVLAQQQYKKLQEEGLL